MLYVFHGTDVESGRKKSRVLIESLRLKRPDAAYEEINADNWNVSVLESHLGGQGLFSNKYIIFLNRIAENVEAVEQIADFIPAMHESTNIFIVLEGKILADLKKVYAKNADKIIECGKNGTNNSRSSGKGEFNIFALADAIGNRDIIRSWMIFRQAIDRGLQAESIIGTLFWQVKSMVLASNNRDASSAGLNPFVFTKSKKFAMNYSGGERDRLLRDIVMLYHDGHRGLADLELGIERLLLKK